jgi:hypothetical protein
MHHKAPQSTDVIQRLPMTTGKRRRVEGGEIGKAQARCRTCGCAARRVQFFNLTDDVLVSCIVVLGGRARFLAPQQEGGRRAAGRVGG